MTTLFEAAQRARAYERKKEKIASDPAYAARARQMGRERMRRYRAEDPRYGQHGPAPKRPGKDRPESRRRREGARRARLRGAHVEHVDALVVLEMDDGACGICGSDVDPENFHVDHITPLVRGGEHSYQNVQVAHPACNVRKGAKELI